MLLCTLDKEEYRKWWLDVFNNKSMLNAGLCVMYGT